MGAAERESHAEHPLFAVVNLASRSNSAQKWSNFHSEMPRVYHGPKFQLATLSIANDPGRTAVSAGVEIVTNIGNQLIAVSGGRQRIPVSNSQLGLRYLSEKVVSSSNIFLALSLPKVVLALAWCSNMAFGHDV